MKIQSLRYWILIADLFWVLGALTLSIYLRYAGMKEMAYFAMHFRTYSLMILAAAVVWTLLYFEMNLDGFKGGWHFFAIVSQLMVAILLLMTVLLAFNFLTAHYQSRLVLLYFALMFFSGVLGLRCIARFLVAHNLRAIANDRCVILGDGPVAKELANKILLHPEIRFQILGFLFHTDLGTSNGFASSLETPFTSVKTTQVVDLLVQQKVHKLIIAMPHSGGAEIQKLITKCRETSIQVYLIPQWYDLYQLKAELLDIDGLPLLSLQDHNASVKHFRLKRIVDFVVSLGILFLVSPILAIAAFAVHRKNGRAFRAELRCGKGGIPFRMYRLNVDRHPPSPKRYERLLVRWSLTELPQVWNVLRGDMSLVGPRPESPERVKYYSDWQRQRLKVPAGITGLAQVHGLRDQHSSEDKSRFDLQYIFNWYPLLDLSLMLQTMWTLLFRGLSQEPIPSQADSFLRTSDEFARREVADVNRS